MIGSHASNGDKKDSLIHQIHVADYSDNAASSEEAWIDVIHKMDEIYTELVESQIELEKKHEELNQAYKTLRNAQQRLIHSEKMAALGRLVAGVAHELNNPISFVFGNMHALKRYGDNLTQYLETVNAKVQDAELMKLRQTLSIDRIEKDIVPLVEGTLEGAERVSDIVQELRRFSGMQMRIAEEFQILPVLETARNWVLRGARTDVSFQIDCPEHLSIVGQKGSLHQIMINLTQNAMDALQDTFNPSITIKTDPGPQYITIEIADNGKGISAADIDQIFEPFFTTKSVGQGTGLGLYISYNMAAEMGGQLTARARKTGGMAFHLKVPLDINESGNAK